MKSKKCSICKNNLLLEKFGKDSSTVDGLDYRCKKCQISRVKEYQKTKNGILTQIYTDQKKTSKQRKDPPPRYSKKELKDWLFSQDLFNKLFDEWVKSNYSKNKKPSVDRKNDYKGYSLSNIQLMTWGENKCKSYKDIKNGINNKRSKAVIQYNLDGSFVNRFHSIMEAERETGFFNRYIVSVCKGRRYHHKNYIWKYE